VSPSTNIHSMNFILERYAFRVVPLFPWHPRWQKTLR
jgi:hypothetical protein